MSEDAVFSRVPPAVPAQASEHERLLALDAKHVWHPFTQAQTARTPLLVERAQGTVLHLSDGRQLLDMISSWWVNLHGHAHPHMVAAIAQQASQLEQVIFAGFTHQPAIELAATLSSALPDPISRVFFSDNGSTATEAALKMALQFWANAGEKRQKILALEGGYHGDTFGAMSAGRSSGFYAPFEALLFEVSTVPCPHTFVGDTQLSHKEDAALAQLDTYLKQHGAQTAAIILEPLLQGASGMRMYRPAFLQALIERVRQYGILVIFDEVLTGFFRTGQLWAALHLQQAPELNPALVPDLVCLSKGITGGFMPLGVTACTEAIYAGFLGDSFDRAFAHGHSYTASPLACAAALASWQLLHSPETQARLEAIQQQHALAAARWQDLPHLSHVRQLGTVLAVDVGQAQAYGAANSLALRAHFEAQGVLLRPLGNTCYLLPPYCVQDDELARAYLAIETATALA